MNYLETLQEVLYYIDEHLNETITINALAKQANFSAYHFCHVFRWGVGYSVMEYVRQRRLAFAASQLSSNARILDIALASGFATHSGFSKAFKRHFGCTPEVYRAHAHPKPLCPPVLTTIKQYSLGGIIMEPKFVTKPSIALVGYTINTTDTDGKNTTEIPQMWENYMSNGQMQKLHAEACVKHHAEYGACLPVNPKTGYFDYMIGVEQKEGCEIPEGYQTATLPPATYVVFSSPATDRASFSQNIQGTWDYIFNEWFPTSGYEYMDGGVDFEYYDERCTGDSNLICDIYIPVTKKV